MIGGEMAHSTDERVQAGLPREEDFFLFHRICVRSEYLNRVVRLGTFVILESIVQSNKVDLEAIHERD